jgi:hypothetical protein
MTITLLDRLRKACEFKNVEGNDFDFERGRQRAHICLQPILSALIEFVENMPTIPDKCGEHSHLGHFLDHKDCDTMREALSALEKTLEGM